MKKILLVFLFLIGILSSLVAFSEDQLELTHNQEFALYQRLQLDTVIARKSSNNRVVLSELELRDLVPSINASNQNYYINFNENLSALKLVDIQRERLEFLHEENQKSALTSLVPNALSIATVAITTGLSNPLGAIIGIVGTTVSSVTSYMDAKNQANLEFMQNQWELDDQEMDILLNLGTQLYDYKCQIATDLNIPTEFTLSTEDLESFVNFCNEPNADTRYIKLLSLDKRLEILPDYWMELALTTYELNDYETTLTYINKFEEIYYPVIYHDSDYAHLLMVKADCINHLPSESKYQDLEEIGDLLLAHIGAEDWQSRFFIMSLYMEIYRATNDIVILRKAYALFPSILVEIGDTYAADLAAYLGRDYVTSGLAEIDIDIKSAESSVEAATSNLAEANKNDYDKDGSAYLNIEQRLNDAEEKLKDLKDYRRDFERTGSLMLPPSSDFLCSVMNEYVIISEKLEKDNSSDFKTICSYFARIVAQSVNTFEEYKELYPSDELSPSKDVIYRYEKSGGFWIIGIGRTHSIVFEIPLSLLNVSSDGSEKLFLADDIELTMSIDGLNDFNFDVVETSIEVGDTLSTSYMTVKINIEDEYALDMLKPDKDSGFSHSVGFTVGHVNSYFEPVVISVDPTSEVFEKIVDRVEYTK